MKPMIWKTAENTQSQQEKELIKLSIVEETSRTTSSITTKLLR